MPEENTADTGGATDVQDTGTTSEVDATEAAQKKAEAYGVDLESVSGSGAGGRVLERDVEKAAASKVEAGKADSGSKLVGVDPDFIGEVARNIDGVRYTFRTGEVLPVSQEVYDALPDKDKDADGNLVYPLADVERGE